MLDIEDCFRPLIEAGAIVGAAIGTVQGDRTATGFVGKIDTADGVAADGRSLFEIGSITKTFTALVLADMVIGKEVGLDDAVSKYVPELASSPIGAATLMSLATHTSGLPRDPDTVDWEMGNPAYLAMSAYSITDLLADAPGFDIGLARKEATYSNLGFALLGHALAVAASLPYAELVAQRVCAPLGMDDTGVLEPGVSPPAMVMGHNVEGRSLPPWHLDGLAPAGGLVSSIRDMLRYADAILQPGTTSLGDAIQLATRPRLPFAAADDLEPGLKVGIAWISTVREGRSYVWHNGSTHGFGSMLALHAETRTAVVALANSGNPDGLGEAAFSLLDSMAGEDIPQGKSV